jgi:hypothetical protein
MDDRLIQNKEQIEYQASHFKKLNEKSLEFLNQYKA